MPRNKPAALAKRDPSERERSAIAAARERRLASPPRVEMDVEIKSAGTVGLLSAHSDQEGGSWHVTDTLGSNSNGWVSRSVLDLVNQSKARGKDPTSDDLNAALAFVSAVNPQDELEAALALQMFAAHDMAMDMSIRAKQADIRPAMQEYGNLATKMMRTFTTQLDALGKHRRGGEQIVRHVHVDARNSQNIIAENVTTGGQNGKVIDQSHEPGTASPGGPALLGTDTAGYGMPVAEAERQEAVQAPRRQRGRAAR